jgi:hypothetical protein
MKPIGLIFKNISYNPFTDKARGELMIIHLCLNCGKISCNRIAGDDNSHEIIYLLQKRKNLDKEIISRLNSHGIILLTENDKSGVLTSLYGKNY